MRRVGTVYAKEQQDHVMFHIRPHITLNAVEVQVLERLLSSGVYGDSYGDVLRTILDKFIEDKTQR